VADAKQPGDPREKLASFSRIAQNNETLLKALPARSYRQALAMKIPDVGTDFFTPRTVASDAPPDIRLGRAMQMRAVDPTHTQMMAERSSLLDDIDPDDLTMLGIEPKKIMGVANAIARTPSGAGSRINISPIAERREKLKQAEEYLERLLNEGAEDKESKARLGRARKSRLAADQDLNEWKVDGEPVRDLKHLKEAAGKKRGGGRKQPPRTLFTHLPRLVDDRQARGFDVLVPIMEEGGKMRGEYRMRPLDGNIVNPPKLPSLEYLPENPTLEVPSDEIKSLIANLISTEGGFLTPDLEISQTERREPGVSSIGTPGATYTNDYLKVLLGSLASNKRDSQPITIRTADKFPLTAEMVHPGTEEEDVLSSRFLAPLHLSEETT